MATVYPFVYVGKYVTDQGAVKACRIVNGPNGRELWGTCDFRGEFLLDCIYSWERRSFAQHIGFVPEA